MGKQKMASQSEQLDEIREELAEIKKFMKKSSNQKRELNELKEKIKFIEERLDDGHPLDLARDFTASEIKNICIKAIAQGVSFYVAYLILGVCWERFLKQDNKK